MPMTGQEDQLPQTGSRPGYPISRPGDAREVAAAVAFLARPHSITGRLVEAVRAGRASGCAPA